MVRTSVPEPRLASKERTLTWGTGHAVEDVITEIRHIRNNVHAGAALRNNFNPAKFKKRDYMRLQGISDAVVDNYNRNL
jgi:hypothetical protein